MKNRTIKELFEVMLENQNHFRCGICAWITDLRLFELINYEEGIILKEYIKNNRPSKFYSWEVFIQHITKNTYYWKFGNLKPRVKWIKKQIKKLS